MKPKKVVIFDIYKTLIDIQIDEENPYVYHFLSRWLSYHGLAIQAEAIHARYHELCHEKMAANPQPYPEIEIGEVFGKMLSICSNNSVEKDSHLVETTSKLFRILSTNSISRYPEVIGILQALSEKFRLGIISNSQHLFTMPELNKFGIPPYFESIVFSSDAKVCKPNPEIFRRLLDSMSITAADAIFVGDNMFDDIWGAKNVGMKAIWINRGTRDTVPDGFEAPVPDAQIDGDSYGRLVECILALV